MTETLIARLDCDGAIRQLDVLLSRVREVHDRILLIVVNGSWGHMVRSMHARIIALTVLWAILYVVLLSLTEFARTEVFEPIKEKKVPEKIRPGQRMHDAVLENEDLNRQMLAGVRLKKANLKGANLEMAMLAGADLREADLELANLKRAMLLGANLSGAKLLNTNFEEANLLGASLEGARIDGANFKHTFLTQDQIDEACGKPRSLPQGFKIPKPC
jgi:uncharacterized protein YjbI with pentapeptide repeats